MRSRRLAVTIALALLLGGCGATAPTRDASSVATSSVAVSPSASSATPGESPAGSPSSSLAAGQTDTAWGRIWDTVPAGFPRFPASTPADDAGGDPVSARFSVPGGEPRAIAAWMQTALEQSRFDTVGLNGPAEDGSFVLDSAGPGDCRIQTTVAPLGDITFISVLYGADCPSEL